MNSTGFTDMRRRVIRAPKKKDGMLYVRELGVLLASRREECIAKKRIPFCKTHLPTSEAGLFRYISTRTEISWTIRMLPSPGSVGEHDVQNARDHRPEVGLSNSIPRKDDSGLHFTHKKRLPRAQCFVFPLRAKHLHTYIMTDGPK